MKSIIITIAPAKLSQAPLESVANRAPAAIRNKNSYTALELDLSNKDWNTISEALDPLLEAISRGWQDKMSREEGETPADGEDS